MNALTLPFMLERRSLLQAPTSSFADFKENRKYCSFAKDSELPFDVDCRKMIWINEPPNTQLVYFRFRNIVQKTS